MKVTKMITKFSLETRYVCLIFSLASYMIRYLSKKQANWLISHCWWWHVPISQGVYHLVVLCDL